MSLVSLLSMRSSLANRRLDSQYNMLQNNNRMLGMLSNPYCCPPQQALAMEKQITFGSIQNQTQAKFCEAWIEALDKQIDKEIKRLNVFA